jgi:RHS repeat-associated protein
LVLKRAYNAQIAAKAESSAFGFGWSGPYSAHLVVNNEAETATVHQNNGAATVFYLNKSTKTYAPGSWVEATLVTEGTSYIFTLPDQTKLEFNSSGQLTKETDRNGNAITLTYKEGKLESVTDGDSRKLSFTYNGNQVESVKDPMGHTVKYTYEAENLTSVTLPGEKEPRWKFEYKSPHLLTKITDGRGNSITMEYDSSNRVTSRAAPLERKRTYKYVTVGSESETKITEPNSSETVELFNSAGEPTKVTRDAGAENAVTEYKYNSSLDKTSMTDPNKHTTEYGYNSTDDKTSEKDPNGDEKKWTYDTKHDIETETTPEGETTTTKRNKNGDPEVIERPIGGETQKTKYVYNEKGDVTEETNELGGVTKYTYDAAGDKEVETDPQENKRKRKYNEDSQEIEETSPRGFATKTERDEQGRPIKITDPLGHTTKYTYDADGNREMMTDGNEHTTKYTYNADDEQTQIEEPNKTPIKTEYDSEGQVKSHTDGNGNVTEYKRNKLEEITEELRPLKHTTKKTYDAAGNLKTLEDPMKRTTTYTYDNSNRLTEISYSSKSPSTVKYEYNKDGKVKKMTDGTGETVNTYDKLDRLTAYKNGAEKVVEYVYNLANAPTQITYPNKENVIRAYDKDKRLEKVTDWENHETKFSYDADSDLSAITFPAATGNEDKYTYNEADQMTEVQMKKGAESLGSLVYARDGDGQVKKTTTKVLPGEEVVEDTYDANNRLIKSATEYEYDKANNTTKIGTNTYTYNTADELEKGTGLTYTYNEDGQRTETKPSAGPTTTYGYDQAGNLTTIKRPEEKAEPKIEDSYTYDGNNLRASQDINGATTKLTWDTAEKTSLPLSDETNSYIYGPENLPIEQISAKGETLYLHHDQQNSTRLLTNATGKTETAYSYTAYGIPTAVGGATTPLLYDAQYTNTDTNLIYLRARVYDPQTAQFLTVDPDLMTTHEPYAYAQDNPLNNSDPTGEEFFGPYGGVGNVRGHIGPIQFSFPVFYGFSPFGYGYPPFGYPPFGYGYSPITIYGNNNTINGFGYSPVFIYGSGNTINFYNTPAAPGIDLSGVDLDAVRR